MLYCAAWSMADVVIAFTYYLAPYWWTYNVIYGIFPSLFLIYYVNYFFVETPQYLISVERNLPESLLVL